MGGEGVCVPVRRCARVIYLDMYQNTQFLFLVFITCILFLHLEELIKIYEGEGTDSYIFFT